MHVFLSGVFILSACPLLVYLLRVVHTIARVLVTVQYALPQIRFVHAKKHLRAVFVVLNLGVPIDRTTWEWYN